MDMDKLLEDYLKNFYNLESVNVDSYYIKNSNCIVKYNFGEEDNISIWEILSFVYNISKTN